MQIFNRDIMPNDATVKNYQDIEALVDVTVLQEKFREHDKLAITAKGRYHKLGQVGILLVALSAIFTIAEVLVLPQVFKNPVLTYVAASMAGTGVLIQCFIIFTSQKKKWLLNRFASERIRSLFFQAYAHAANAKDAAHLRELVNDFAQSRLTKLDNELNAGLSVLSNFSPSRVLETLPRRKRPANRELTDRAIEAFLELRVNYQLNFARSEIKKFKSRRRIFNSTQDMIYLAAAIFTFLSLALKIFGTAGLAISTHWIDFMAITLFIMGSTEAIMDNALLEDHSESRYDQYAREIESAIADDPELKKDLPALVEKIERICLGELDRFCAAAEKISYRF